jgi:DNA-directed RNA polymerase alpha subunit
MKPLQILLTINVQSLTNNLKTSGAVVTKEKEVSIAVKEATNPTEEKISAKIADQNLTVRSKNALMKNGIKTLRTLGKRTEEEISSIKGIGKNSISEILAFKSSLQEQPIELKVVKKTSAKKQISAKKQKIQDLDLSVRSENALIKAGITYVAELQKLSDEELRNLRGVGTTVVNELSAYRKEVKPTTKNDFEDMDLSVRTLNSLSKAGIKSIAALSKFSLDEFRKIKGVGVTVMEEINTILGNKPDDAVDSNDKDALANLELSNRTFNALKNAGITTVSQLEGKSDAELSNLKGVGATVMEEVSAIRSLSTDVKTDTSTKQSPKFEAKVKSEDKNAIEHLNLSTRAFNALTGAGIAYVEDLKTMSHVELNKLKGVGATIIDELDITLKNFKTIVPKSVKALAPKLVKTEAPKSRVHKKMHDIHDLNLSTRHQNALIKAGMNFVEDLSKMSDNDLTRVKGIGITAVKEIRDLIHTQMPMLEIA